MPGKKKKERSPSTKRAALLIVACIILAATGWYLLRGTPPASVVLITLDTTRWDYVGTARAKAPVPHIAGIAAEGALFQEALTAVPLTLPAHASLLTGLYPPLHKVRNNGAYILGEGIPLLPQILSENGYETAAFVGSFVLDARFGLARGFHVYDDELESGPLSGMAGERFNLAAERKASAVTERAIAWLAGGRRHPFFLWVHYYDPHDPYEPPSPFRERFKEDPYAGEIAYVDYEIGRLLSQLSRVDGAEDAALVVIGDHGESLGEHGEATHGFFLYESAVRIPLIMKLPGVARAGTIVEDAVSIVDITPTLLAYLGIDVPPNLDGRNLLPLLSRGVKNQEDCVIETLYPLENFGWSPLFSLRSGPYKYIRAPKPELYDITRDPGELVNLISTEHAVAEDMASRLEARLSRGGGAQGSPGQVDPETESKLASLGYIWRSAGEGGKELRDPKDMTEVRKLLNTAESLMASGRYAESIETFREVLRQDPGNQSPLNQIGLIFYRMNHPDSALHYLTAAAAQDPDNAGAHHNLAAVYEQIGDLERALEEYEKAAQLNPSSVEDIVAQGKLRLKKGDRKEALESFTRARSLDPGNPEISIGLADVALRDGRYKEAIDRLTDGIGKAPRSATLHNKLGTVYQLAGRSTEALSEYEQALAIDPNHIDALFNRGTIRIEKGLFEGAAADFTRLLPHPDYRSKALYSLAVIDERTGNREKAIEKYSQFIEVWDGDPAMKEEAARRIKGLQGG
jgi:tetratricopeptide (TPR) repeat protein